MRSRSAYLTLGLAFSLIAAAAPAAPVQQPADTPANTARTTVDPQPPMALAVEVAGIQKHARGGVVSLLLKVGSDLGVEGTVLTARVPGDLRFADGSREKTWNIDLSSGGVRTIPVEVLVPRDGRHSISAEAVGMLGGRPLRRGAAGSVWVGRHEPPEPPSRAGAVEYRAVEAVEE